jgi:hypothetical protein
LDDFKRALARVQSDYDFYIGCQTDPAVALAGYSLSPDERLALSDPETLADVLKSGIGISRLRPITIKISGKHDWVNRAATRMDAVDQAEHEAKVGLEVEAIKRASTHEERTGAVVRLMGLVG